MTTSIESVHTNHGLFLGWAGIHLTLVEYPPAGAGVQVVAPTASGRAWLCYHNLPDGPTALGLSQAESVGPLLDFLAESLDCPRCLAAVAMLTAESLG